jgi:hypothetical protein
MQKRCSRCGGNEFRIRDQYGEYLSCLQCGRTRDVAPSDGLNLVLKGIDRRTFAGGEDRTPRRG